MALYGTVGGLTVLAWGIVCAGGFKGLDWLVGLLFFDVWFELMCGYDVCAGQVLRVVTLWCIVAGMRCEECGEVVPVRSGRVPKFCSGACRQRAYRARVKAERAAVPALPSRMTGVRRWVRAVGKRPFRVDGRWASSTKDWTWASFDDVQSGFGDGFGVMLGDGLACLDLDNCFDGEGGLHWWADDAVMDVAAPLWVERSVSGRGLHVFFECPEGPGRVRKYGAGEVALYSRARFILVTGDYFRL